LWDNVEGWQSGLMRRS